MKKICISILLFILIVSLAGKVFADSAINNGINYLGTQLNGPTGQITGGSTGDASPWAAIAFSANNIDPSTVKTSTNAPSLVDYLKNNPPTTSSSATDWEKWILAIVAAGKDPTNFGGINYVSTLASSTYYNNNQIGDTTTENDDWFGVLALIASGVSSSNNELTDSIAFILSHQNSDGGFGYSTTAGSDGNDTAAAVQALVAAQEYGVSNVSLCTAITNAKAYLLTTQDAATGGFLYDTNPWTTAPDTDSTTWALMALNVLGMQNSQEATNAKAWLTTSPQQSTTDGGFTACDQWDPNTFACTGVASNATTTSHALIALAGRGWILKTLGSLTCSSSETTPTPTLTVTPTPTSTPTDTPTLTPISVPNFTTVATPTFAPTPTVVPVALLTQKVLGAQNTDVSPTPIIKDVLGTQTHVTYVAGTKNTFLPIAFIILGSLFLLAGLGRLGYNYFQGK